jgi:hypothetical protein
MSIYQYSLKPSQQLRYEPEFTSLRRPPIIQQRKKKNVPKVQPPLHLTPAPLLTKTLRHPSTKATPAHLLSAHHVENDTPRPPLPRRRSRTAHPMYLNSLPTSFILRASHTYYQGRCWIILVCELGTRSWTDALRMTERAGEMLKPDRRLLLRV